MAGGSFMPGTPVYSTGEAEAYGHEGGGKALVDGFAAAFGEAFDASVAQVTNLVEGDELEPVSYTHLRSAPQASWWTARRPS